ncbi:helix-turn-helix transcriptional regulator [Paenibacillus sp. GCM10027626]|uniref:helix-turn-helix transcriptional regulator n=1 Tax=Paenibacillus sp. GCM10027626 TaxID=3273411 RepID=UPI003644DEA3
MNNPLEYIQALNKEYGVSLSGLSPIHGSLKKVPKTAARIVVENFGNGLGRVLYVDNQNRLIANNMEPLVVGLAEAAEMLGWSKQQVTLYISRDKFPEPSLRLASGPLWTIEQIEEYRDARK